MKPQIQIKEKYTVDQKINCIVYLTGAIVVVVGLGMVIYFMCRGLW